ncbi:MAG: hypothetical protein AAF763_19975 [Pseudomonadota bacterium]
MPDPRAAAALSLAAALSPAPAAAHGAVPGLEGVQAGLGHIFSTPGQICALLALALLNARDGPLSPRDPRFARYAAAALCGAALGLTGTPLKWAEPALLAAAALIGALAALLPHAVPAATRAAALAAGAALGLSAVPPFAPWIAVIPTLGGSLAGALLAAPLLAAVLSRAHAAAPPPWPSLALRIAAAWTSAAAVLLLALIVTLHL